MTVEIQLSAGRGGMTRAFFQGEIVSESRFPMCDAAKALLDRGFEQAVLSFTRDGRPVGYGSAEILARGR
jgi:hypothetical protein